MSVSVINIKLRTDKLLYSGNFGEVFNLTIGELDKDRQIKNSPF